MHTPNKGTKSKAHSALTTTSPNISTATVSTPRCWGTLVAQGPPSGLQCVQIRAHSTSSTHIRREPTDPRMRQHCCPWNIIACPPSQPARAQSALASRWPLMVLLTTFVACCNECHHCRGSNTPTHVQDRCHVQLQASAAATSPHTLLSSS